MFKRLVLILHNYVQMCGGASNNCFHTVRQLRIESSIEESPTVFTELVNSGTQYLQRTYIHTVATVQLYESGCQLGWSPCRFQVSRRTAPVRTVQSKQIGPSSHHQSSTKHPSSLQLEAPVRVWHLKLVITKAFDHFVSIHTISITA